MYIKLAVSSQPYNCHLSHTINVSQIHEVCNYLLKETVLYAGLSHLAVHLAPMTNYSMVMHHKEEKLLWDLYQRVVGLPPQK